MVKETLTFNKDNWSGENATIDFVEFAGTLEFSVNGDLFRLAREFRVYDDNPKFSWTQYDLEIKESNRWRDTGYDIGKHDTDSHWLATNENGDFTRDDTHKGVAACKLIFNLF